MVPVSPSQSPYPAMAVTAAWTGFVRSSWKGTLPDHRGLADVVAQALVGQRGVEEGLVHVRGVAVELLVHLDRQHVGPSGRSTGTGQLAEKGRRRRRGRGHRVQVVHLGEVAGAGVGALVARARDDVAVVDVKAGQIVARAGTRTGLHGIEAPLGAVEHPVGQEMASTSNTQVAGRKVRQ
jgi:hypothetical protein